MHVLEGHLVLNKEVMAGEILPMPWCCWTLSDTLLQCPLCPAGCKTGLEGGRGQWS